MSVEKIVGSSHALPVEEKKRKKNTKTKNSRAREEGRRERGEAGESM